MYCYLRGYFNPVESLPHDMAMLVLLLWYMLYTVIIGHYLVFLCVFINVWVTRMESTCPGVMSPKPHPFICDQLLYLGRGVGQRVFFGRHHAGSSLAIYFSWSCDDCTVNSSALSHCACIVVVVVVSVCMHACGGIFLPMFCLLLPQEFPMLVSRKKLMAHLV